MDNSLRLFRFIFLSFKVRIAHNKCSSHHQGKDQNTSIHLPRMTAQLRLKHRSLRTIADRLAILLKNSNFEIANNSPSIWANIERIFLTQTKFLVIYGNKIFVKLATGFVATPPRFSRVWPDWAIDWTLGNFSKALATINLPNLQHS